MKIIFGYEETKKVFDVYLKEALIKYENDFVINDIILDAADQTIEITVLEKPEEETED